MASTTEELTPTLIKARRLLATGKAWVKWSTPENVCAVVRGDTGLWDIDLHADRWNCTCLVRIGPCSHLQAVWLVTVLSEVLQDVRV
jgi:hypothetical protein